MFCNGALKYKKNPIRRDPEIGDVLIYSYQKSGSLQNPSGTCTSDRVDNILTRLRLLRR